ncbi:MAG: hypothetical protein ABIQ17_02545 [Candidatus Limnocylindrales bacterium]
MIAGVRADAAALRRLEAAGARRAAGSRLPALIIEFFASRCCTNVMVGDLQTRWVDDAPRGAVDLGTLAGVQLLADPRIAGLLTDAGATLIETGSPFRRSLGIRLDSPEQWLAFLESPAARRGPTANDLPTSTAAPINY